MERVVSRWRAVRYFLSRGVSGNLSFSFCAPTLYICIPSDGTYLDVSTDTVQEKVFIKFSVHVYTSCYQNQNHIHLSLRPALQAHLTVNQSPLAKILLDNHLPHTLTQLFHTHPRLTLSSSLCLDSKQAPRYFDFDLGS